MRTANLQRTLVFVLALLAFGVTAPAQAFVGVSVGFAPPALPVYVQPACPGPGYLWTPGYWAYDPSYGYYWVPGTWVLAPIGLLWTPGYWAFANGLYVWNAGYWGPRVGFYGGIDYGFGYFGRGYDGGYWHNRDFYYNRAVNHIDGRSIRNVYSRPAVHDPDQRHLSFDGPSGVHARPTTTELAMSHQPHYGPTSEQRRHESVARTMPELRASANHGEPRIAAIPRAGAFSGHGVSVAHRTEVTHATRAPSAGDKRPYETRVSAANSRARTPVVAQQRDEQRSAPGRPHDVYLAAHGPDSAHTPSYSAARGGRNEAPARVNAANRQGDRRPPQERSRG